MNTKTYDNAGSFLRDTQAELESNQAASGLLLGICLQLGRDPGGTEAPPCLKTVRDGGGLVLAAVMTPPYKLVVYGHQGDLVDGAGVLVDSLLADGWTIPGVLGPSDAARRVVEAWAARTGQPYELERRQVVYQLREVQTPVPERGRLRLAAEADIPLVARWRHDVYAELFGHADRAEALRVAELGIAAGDVCLWDDGGPVSMAMKVRPVGSGISVSRVYTPPELRGRGYATACVGELSRLLLASGWRRCTLYADQGNPAANRVYEKVGYRPVCDYDEYRVRTWP
jgi:predicted GNAT family acetyltransferase